MTRWQARRAIAVLAAVAVASASPLGVRADEAAVTARVTVNPLHVTFALAASQASVGQRIKAEATVRNDGPTRTGAVTVELRVPSDAIRIKGEPVQVIARLRPGQHATVVWTVCGRTAGSYVLLARASLDGSAVESAGRLLTVTAGRDRGC